MTINKKGLYIGLVLYTFFKHNNNVRPSIVELPQDDLSCFEMTPSVGDSFYLFIKYRGSPAYKSTDGSLTWTFSLTDYEKEQLDKYRNTGKKVFLCIFCYNKDKLSLSNFAMLTHKEYSQLKDQSSITIKLQKTKKHFERSLQLFKDRKPLFYIPRNRIEKDLLSIKDAI